MSCQHYYNTRGMSVDMDLFAKLLDIGLVSYSWHGGTAHYGQIYPHYACGFVLCTAELTRGVAVIHNTRGRGNI